MEEQYSWDFVPRRLEHESNGETIVSETSPVSIRGDRIARIEPHGDRVVGSRENIPADCCEGRDSSDRRPLHD
jgi:hypothetical protein